MKSLDIPVMNEWGLRPAVVKGTRDPVPLTAFRDLDKKGLLNNVSTFCFHQHLPHYALTEQDGESVQVLARQRVDPDRPHPFTAAGNSEFNCSALAAADAAARRRHPDGGLNEFHHAVRWHGEVVKLLAELRPDEMSDKDTWSASGRALARG